MADGTKISALPVATAATESDVLAGVQTGTTKKFSLGVLLSWIKSALLPSDIGAQDALTFDQTPTEGSTNPVTSGGVAEALSQEIIKISVAAFSALPVTVSNAAITANHVLLRASLGTPGAQTGDWTWTTAAGSITISGSINGSTTLELVLGLPGTTI